jgi:methanethiol S-methyltransferase
VVTVARLLRWSGGFAFAASLASAGYVLGVVWPRVAPMPPAGIPAASLWNALLFTLFAAHHSVLARTGVKRRLEVVAPILADRSTYVWVASLLLAATVFGWEPIGHQVWRASGVTRVLCWFLQGTGGILILLAGRIIDPLELAGIHAANRDPLEVRGPYRLVRHPIYLGAILLLWATPVMTGDRLTFAALATVYIALAIPWEESSMRSTIGDAYDRYRARVPWRIVPGAY